MAAAAALERVSAISHAKDGRLDIITSTEVPPAD